MNSSLNSGLNFGIDVDSDPEIVFDLETVSDPAKRPSHTRMGVSFILLTPVNPK
jgi:hypothetical protein